MKVTGVKDKGNVNLATQESVNTTDSHVNNNTVMKTAIRFASEVHFSGLMHWCRATNNSLVKPTVDSARDLVILLYLYCKT